MEGESNKEVDGTKKDKKVGPGKIQSTPGMIGHADSMFKHHPGCIFLCQEMAAQENCREYPVYNRGFPLQDSLLPEDNRKGTEYQHSDECDDLGPFQFFIDQEQ